ncbi:MAG: 3-phosphoshikimate 1-carboxyvinyltransferase [Sphaerochaetaceae bacterium]|nr:3-phosphoshikimate 1-carboxyvinyltransferase [Sphaerochaetaceae bacterium]
MDRTLYPGSVLGQVDIPASKGQTFRALLIALLAKGTSIIHNPRLTPDTQACIEFAQKLGAKIQIKYNTLFVDSSDMKPNGSIEIDCKNSGSTLYFATALSCLFHVPVTFKGDESLTHRPVRPLLTSLRNLGAKIEPQDPESIPYTVCGPIAGGHTSIRCMTNQYLSALLLVCPMAEGDTTIDVPLLMEKPFVKMTEHWLENQGIEFFRNDDMSHYTIKGGQSYKPFETTINGDFGSATPFFCAAAITGGTVTVNGLDSNSTQGDSAILPILQKMGCSVQCTETSVTLKGPNKLKAADFDLGGIPDALPALAVTACFASGPVKLYNVSQARLKESDRITSVAASINAIGGQAREMPDGIEVFPVMAFQGSRQVKSYHDHRVVMAMALASLKCTGGLTIQDCECIDLRFPSFFEKFNSVIC